MTVIALSAAPGTVDRRFASGLADAHGLELVDLRPLEIDVARRCDARTGQVQRWVGGYVFAKANLSQRELIRRLREQILALAGRGDILIVSWSASVVLRDPFPAVRVAVTGDRSLRESKISANLHFADVRTAGLEVASEDALIARFIWQTFGVDWQDASLYDLVIDVGGQSEEHAAEQLRPLLLGSRFRPLVANAIRSEGAFAREGKVVIDKDAVSLSGLDSHEDAIAKVEKRLHGCCDKPSRIDPFLSGS